MFAYKCFMGTNFIDELSLWKSLSWNKSIKLVHILQNRLFKSVLVGDMNTALELQKLLLQSNCSRLVAIRYVTQLCPNRKLSGPDGKTALTFLERFELNEYLKKRFNDWNHGCLRTISVFEQDGFTKTSIKIANISDRVWQYLIKISIEPVHEVFFHPCSFGFRGTYNLYSVQKYFLLNLSYFASGYQKRIFYIDLSNSLSSFNINFLLNKLLVPRSIKLCIRRLFNNDFTLGFTSNFSKYLDLRSILSNILLNGIEDIHRCARFGYFLVYFLNPNDNEKFIFDNTCKFLLERGISSDNICFDLSRVSDGFDFLGWHFHLNFDREIFCLPSSINYQNFLLRVKRIINNSNYGSVIKSNKLYPLIKEWRLYHRFSNLKGAQFSLFFMKKRAFAVFSKESRQDFYSTKLLLDKSFYFLNSLKNTQVKNSSFNSSYYGHVFLGTIKDYGIFESSRVSKNFLAKYFICIHCGMNIVF